MGYPVAMLGHRATSLRLRALGLAVCSTSAGCGNCKGLVYFALDELIFGPGIPFNDQSGGVGWDGTTALDYDLFANAAAPLEYKEAGALSLEYAKSLPPPSPFGTATASHDEGDRSLPIGPCLENSMSPFDCRLETHSIYFQVRQDETTILALELSDSGTPAYNPYAKVRIEVLYPNDFEQYVNLGAETDGSVLYAALHWAPVSCY